MRSKPILIFVLPLMLTVLAIGLTCCGRRDKMAVGDGDTLYAPRYASGFEIVKVPGESDSAGVIIKVKNPWQGASDVVESLLIDRTADGHLQVPGVTQKICGDARRIVVMSSTAVAMLDAIGRADVITGVSGRRWISSPSLTARLDSVQEVGFEGNIDYEAILAANPDLVVVYGVSGPSQMTEKLAAMGIPMIYLGDYVEESPLGKSEWMVVMGELTGDREAAIKAFDRIVPRYENLAARVREAVTRRPKVMFNLPYGDVWYMPGRSSYQVKLVEDAGGEYHYTGADAGTVSKVIDSETAMMLASEADVWLNTGSASTIAQMKSAVPKFIDVKALKTNQVYNNNTRLNPQGGNDYFESGAIRPDLVLRDLVKIFHPSLVKDSLVFYQQLK